jgi:predicted N-formylglutamate amidohydrolase
MTDYRTSGGQQKTRRKSWVNESQPWQQLSFFLAAGGEAAQQQNADCVERSLDTRLQEDLGTKPYRVIEGDASTGLLVLCDHAENMLPEAYGTLGLRAEDLHRHVAYDLGAAALAERLADALGAPAVLSRFSRLLIDPNRGLDDPTLVMQISDGLIVPGNVGLGEDELHARIERYYTPYHQAIARAVETGVAWGKPPVIVSVHSFTQAWKGAPRPWSVGVLWDKDPRLALPLLTALRAVPGIEVGDNVPYSGQLKGDTLYRHGTAQGLAHALVEVRQDLILGPEGQAAWASRLARILRKVLSEAGRTLHVIELHGSFTDREGRVKGEPRDGRKGRPVMDEKTRIEIEAAAFRHLLAHLRERTDVQNIDLMELAGFCRNCLANWYQEAAAERGISVSKEQARELVYGMAYEDWKAKFQTDLPAKPRQRAG